MSPLPAAILARQRPSRLSIPLRANSSGNNGAYAAAHEAA
jgi:hypothetical protein